MKPIKRVNSDTPLAPLKDVKLKELPKQAVIDPTLTPEQLRQYKAMLSREKIQRSLDKTMAGLHSSYVKDLEKGERATEEEIELENQELSSILAEHQNNQAKLREELFARNGMKRDSYIPPEDDGNHIIVRDNSVKNPDLQHTVEPLPGIINPLGAHRNPRANIPKK